MKVLLDTHVWLWSVVSPERITPEVRDVLENPDNALILSVASSWEIAIKYRLGKLSLPEPPEEFIQPRLIRDGIESLPIEHRHAVASRSCQIIIAIRSTGCSLQWRNWNPSRLSRPIPHSNTTTFHS